MNKKRRILSKTLSILLLIICLVSITAAGAFADAGSTTANIEIVSSFTLKDTMKPTLGTECKYLFTPMAPTNPAPAGAAADGSVLLVFDGIGTTSKTIPITFTQEGIYQYKVTPIIETNDKKVYYEYDKTTYTVAVYVMHGKDGLENVVTVTNDSTGSKCDSVHFSNWYTFTWQKFVAGLGIQTGDESNLTLWILLFILCLVLLAVSVYVLYRKRKRKSEE